MINFDKARSNASLTAKQPQGFIDMLKSYKRNKGATG